MSDHFTPGPQNPLFPPLTRVFALETDRFPHLGAHFGDPNRFHPRDPNIPAFDTRFRHSTVVVKKMVHRKNIVLQENAPAELFLDIPATILLCRITFQRHLAPSHGDAPLPQKACE